MRIYLDNCCFNRPFDDQSGIRVKLETDAKLYVQLMIKTGVMELAWSYILDFENNSNPFFERKYTITKWKEFAVIDCLETQGILLNAIGYTKIGIKSKDALHIACAASASCDYFLTTDDVMLKKSSKITEITIIIL